MDDPADCGEIPAANAMSDVYGMGGEVVALNICGFPASLPAEVLCEILAAWVVGGVEEGRGIYVG